MKKEKTRNNGTMTESQFWSWVRSSLRRRTMYWKPIQAIKMDNRRKNTGEGRHKFEYQCKECKNWFPENTTVRGKKKKNINVDHIVEAGSLKSGADLDGFISRLFCEKDGLQILCSDCHDIKTKEYKKSQKTKSLKK